MASRATSTVVQVPSSHVAYLGLRGAAQFGRSPPWGLRICETLSLRNGDIDLKDGMLNIRQTKFGKSRQVRMHRSTVDALRRYRGLRDMAEGPPAADSPFFVGTRGPRRSLPLGDRQVHRVFRDLRQQLGWGNRGAHDAPRIHDLRHTFVVRRIVQWQAQGGDIDQAMLSLLTYVGHTMVTNTYWYLSVVPGLMALAGGCFDPFTARREVQDA